jgi:hypothetical protein
MVTANLAEWAGSLRHVRDEELRRALAELFVRAGELAATPAEDERPAVIVLVSRRLSCVYHMLLASGLDALEPFDVITDRALDGGMADLAGRRVVLVDDSIVLGTTLVDLYDDIVDRVGAQERVTTLVAAVDSDRCNLALAERVGLGKTGLQVPIERSTKELEQFAFDVASCLYRSGVPYFTDFPACAPFTTTKSLLFGLLNSPRWRCADVSAPRSFAGSDRKAWTLVPTADTSARIRSRGVAAATRLTDVFKARVYATIDEFTAKDVRIVPIGIPGTVARPHLDSIMAALRSESGFDLECDDWRPRAKHRLLQMYLSSCVLAELWPEVVPLGVGLTLGQSALDRAPLETYFGKASASVALDAFDALVAAYTSRNGHDVAVEPATPLRLPSGLGLRPPVRRRMLLSRLTIDATEELAHAGRLSLLDAAVEPAEPRQGEIGRVDPFWALHVLLVFGFVDKDLERKQEEILREYDYPRYVKYREQGGDELAGPRVLKQGITMHELRSWLLPDADMSSAWHAAMISLAVDFGNDLGVVVPTTIDSEDGIVTRQYRSGETAFLTAVAPEDLLRNYRDDIKAGNPFCWAVLEDLARSGRDVLAEFYADLGAIVSHAIRGELAQAWQGTVTERLDAGGFRAVVESRLVDGVTDVAELSEKIVDQGDWEQVRKGSRFDWIVWQGLDVVGKPEMIARVRLAASSAPSQS